MRDPQRLGWCVNGRPGQNQPHLPLQREFQKQVALALVPTRQPGPETQVKGLDAGCLRGFDVTFQVGWREGGSGGMVHALRGGRPTRGPSELPGPPRHTRALDVCNDHPVL